MAKFLWNLAKLMGTKWREYVKGLAKQQPLLLEFLAPVTPAIIKGEAQVGIAYIKLVKQYKGPISYVPLDKYLSDPNHLALGPKAARSSDLLCPMNHRRRIEVNSTIVMQLLSRTNERKIKRWKRRSFTSTGHSYRKARQKFPCWTAGLTPVTACMM